jgi:hypothetical protein
MSVRCTKNHAVGWKLRKADQWPDNTINNTAPRSGLQNDMLAVVWEVCSALKQKSITRAECNWDVAALEDNCWGAKCAIRIITTHRNLWSTNGVEVEGFLSESQGLLRWITIENEVEYQGFTKLHSSRVRMDSGCRDLKNILIAIPPRTTSDLSWEASAWWRRPWVTISDSDLWRKPRRVCFRLPPGLSIFYIIFLLCYLLVSLLWLVCVVKPLYYFSWVLKSTLFTSNSFPQFFLSILVLS